MGDSIKSQSAGLAVDTPRDKRQGARGPPSSNLEVPLIEKGVGETTRASGSTVAGLLHRCRWLRRRAV